MRLMELKGVFFMCCGRRMVSQSGHSRLKCGLAITSLTTMLERMENQGLIRRVQSETDKRKTLLFLTEKAHALKGEYDSVSDEMGSIYYKGFSEEEIAV